MLFYDFLQFNSEVENSAVQQTNISYHLQKLCNIGFKKHQKQNIDINFEIGLYRSEMVLLCLINGLFFTKTVKII